MATETHPVAGLLFVGACIAMVEFFDRWLKWRRARRRRERLERSWRIDDAR